MTLSTEENPVAEPCADLQTINLSLTAFTENSNLNDTKLDLMQTQEGWLYRGRPKGPPGPVFCLEAQTESVSILFIKVWAQGKYIETFPGMFSQYPAGWRTPNS